MIIYVSPNVLTITSRLVNTLWARMPIYCQQVFCYWIYTPTHTIQIIGVWSKTTLNYWLDDGGEIRKSQWRGWRFNSRMWNLLSIDIILARWWTASEHLHRWLGRVRQRSTPPGLAGFRVHRQRGNGQGLPAHSKNTPAAATLQSRILPSKREDYGNLSGRTWSGAEFIWPDMV